MNKILLWSLMIVTTLWPAGIIEASAKKSAQKKPAATASSKTTGAVKPDYGISRVPYVGAIVVEATTGQVLFEENADAKVYPASTLKLMDLLIILEKVQKGQLKLTDKVTVSAEAAKMGGSQVWLEKGETFTLDEMLYALMVQSANDAAVALAEHVAGSKQEFVNLMNQRARELGMKATVFRSVHGLPPDAKAGQQPDETTPRDMTLLCRELLKHKDALRYTSTREREFRKEPKLLMRNHNKLLETVAGCDGLKTGYFQRAGFSIAATAARNGRRVIAVVMGARASNERIARLRGVAEANCLDVKTAELINRAFATLAANPPKPTTASPLPAAVNPAGPSTTAAKPEPPAAPAPKKAEQQKQVPWIWIGVVAFCGLAAAVIGVRMVTRK
ncbi:MAG: D-alanyl-D-alanine carboxypeptidase [Verrucomicrobiae bacterium]|nr:D-alanyl-D-alanine carboxypeptidase [Verrucomicrobiae bacterium]